MGLSESEPFRSVMLVLPCLDAHLAINLSPEISSVEQCQIREGQNQIKFNYINILINWLCRISYLCWDEPHWCRSVQCLRVLQWLHATTPYIIDRSSSSPSVVVTPDRVIVLSSPKSKVVSLPLVLANCAITCALLSSPPHRSSSSVSASTPVA